MFVSVDDVHGCVCTLTFAAVNIVSYALPHHTYPLAAELNLLKVPSQMHDLDVLLLSDVLSTAWHANEMGEVGKGDTVAIWGAG